MQHVQREEGHRERNVFHPVRVVSVRIVKQNLSKTAVPARKVAAETDQRSTPAKHHQLFLSRSAESTLSAGK